jgi:hypothetical protein
MATEESSGARLAASAATRLRERAVSGFAIIESSRSPQT